MSWYAFPLTKPNDKQHCDRCWVMRRSILIMKYTFTKIIKEQ